MIIVKTKYFELIKKRLKVQTIRKNSRFYQSIKVGDIGYVSNYREKLKIQVTHRYVKLARELTEEEAILDGFNDREELLSVLPLEDFEALFIRFKLVAESSHFVPEPGN